MSDPGPHPTERLVATITGDVQGVGFRWFAQREATRIGLDGWVVNQADGSVEVVVEGDPAALRAMAATLRAGPPAASIRGVAVRFEPARRNLSGFVIRGGAHRGD